MKYFLISLSGMVVGICCGAGVLFFLSQTTLPFQVRSYAVTLGVQKSQVFGFLPYWLVSKADANEDQHLTTLAYFALQVDGDGHLVHQNAAKETEPGWLTIQKQATQTRLAHAKQQHVQLSLVIGGGNEDSLAQLIADPETHAQNLIAEVAPVMKENGFTDLNLDLESFRTASDSSRQNFTTFAQTLKNELTVQKLGSLSVDVSPSIFVKKMMIDPVAIGKIADAVVIMMYDFSSRGSLTIGPPAPLAGHGQVREFDMSLALQQALTAVSAAKIIVALPVYGYEWESLLPTPGGAIIPQTGATATQQRVTQLLQSCKNCVQGRDEVAQEAYVLFPDPMASSSTHQIFYDDALSIQNKLAFAQQFKVGGVGLWALGYEDGQLWSAFRH